MKEKRNGRRVLVMFRVPRSVHVHNRCFFLSFAGDSPDHERGDGAQDESAGLQPEEHASRGPTDEQTLPSQHSQVAFIIVIRA